VNDYLLYLVDMIHNLLGIKMDTTMDFKTKHYKIDTYIKETIIEKYNLDDNMAEAITYAMDMKDHDMTSYATKLDLKDLEIKIYALHAGTVMLMLGVMGRWLGKW